MEIKTFTLTENLAFHIFLSRSDITNVNSRACIAFDEAKAFLKVRRELKRGYND